MTSGAPSLRVRWRIYYGDGSTYSDRDGPPESAPPLNVQVVASASDNLREFTLSHGDERKNLVAWVWAKDGWSVVDDVGFWDYLFHTRGWTKAIFGRSIATDDFHAILRRAAAEGIG